MTTKASVTDCVVQGEMFSAKLLAEWHPTKNGTLKLTDFTPGSNKKGWWLCPDTFECGCPHEFQAIIQNRVKSKTKGCPHCAPNPTALCVHRSIVFTHPEIAKMWHPTKNGELLPSMVRAGSDKEAWWLCTTTCPYGCPHEFKRKVDIHVRLCEGRCPFCTQNTQTMCFHQSLAFTHPEIANEWHPTLNGNLTPAMITAGSQITAWWMCTRNIIHMEYQMTIAARTLQNQKCHQCHTYDMFLYKENSLARKFPSVAEQLHPTLNGSITAEDIAGCSHDKFWWGCDESFPDGTPHRPYEMRVINKTLGENGCPDCAKNQPMRHYTQSLEYRFPEIAKLWDHEKNFPLKPSEVSCGRNFKAWWICENGHSHQQSISDKCRRIGCLFCRHKTQAMVLKFLKQNFPNVENEVYFEWCPTLSDWSGAKPRFDMVIEKIIIEIDGPQHFKQVMNWQSPEDQRKSDLRKMILAIDNGFTIIRILQEDVYHDKYDWKTELLGTISTGQNAFLCKNGEYDEMQTQLKKKRKRDEDD
jgi:hypothetical protein